MPMAISATYSARRCLQSRQQLEVLAIAGVAPAPLRPHTDDSDVHRTIEIGSNSHTERN